MNSTIEQKTGLPHGEIIENECGLAGPARLTADSVESGDGVMKELQGRVCFVTGGSRGIGGAIVLALAQAGADVAFTYVHHHDMAEEICGAARGQGVRCNAYEDNAASTEETERVIRQVVAEFGPIQILVNNAGITRDKSFIKMTKEMWDEVIHVNLDGLYNSTHAILPAMIESGWGRIVNVASIVGQTGNFGQANYAATKGGAIAFTETLARELARKNITVNAVAPGFIETDMTKDMPEAALAQVKAMTPVGRLGKPEEVAAAVIFLASPRSGYITGQVLAVNGGMYM
jgi:3-oxoacyl-(acyl-carrier-protein) reductase